MIGYEGVVIEAAAQHGIALLFMPKEFEGYTDLVVRTLLSPSVEGYTDLAIHDWL